MKQLHTVLLYLALMLLASPLTSCSGNGDVNPGAPLQESDVLISYNSNLFKFSGYGQGLNPHFIAKGADGAELLMQCPLNVTTFKITYPSKTFGDITASYFKVGDALNLKGTPLLFTNATGTEIAQYLAGTATVTANDGQTISIAVNNLIASSPSHEIHIHKGTIKYQVVSE